ncbi:uncharacterized protein [Littorina saxatilis]|uniref:uncharacterized protein n=1 Tax=Littorina saxatilis TaxID=31220 RepID=UPI0038B60634
MDDDTTTMARICSEISPNISKWSDINHTSKHLTISVKISKQRVHVFSQNCEKIAPGGSTKEVESFNNMVTSKAPKRCHFPATNNLVEGRVCCGTEESWK